MVSLSVVIPVYNGERHIDNIVSCFKSQTTKDFQLIFVNDGSSDGSLQKLKSYESRREELGFGIKVIDMQNKGVSAARNAGLAAVDTEFVSFADVDDRVTTDYVSTLKTMLGSFDMFFFQSERVPETSSFEDDYNELNVTRINGAYMLNVIAFDPTKYGVYNFFARTAFIRENNLTFAEGYPYYEDYDFLYRAAALAQRVAFSGHRLYFYVISDNSAVASFRVERLQCVKLLEDAVPFIRQHAPQFAETYVNEVIPRIYWSVLWQASLAFPLRDFLRFAIAGSFHSKIKSLIKNKNKKVSVSTGLYLICPLAYFAAARVLGRSRSKIKRTPAEPFIEYFKSTK